MSTKTPVPPPNYTQAPNMIFDLMPEMTECELKVVMAICRKTFGWHKRRDRLSLTQLEELTGLSRQGVIDGIERGEERGILDKQPEGNSFSYGLVVKDADQTKEGSQESRPGTVKNLDHSLVKNLDTQKKEIKKRKEISIDTDAQKDFAAVFRTLESAMGHMSPRECELVRQLWEEKPDLDAHHYAYLQTQKYANGFNLKYYERCLNGYRPNGNAQDGVPRPRGRGP